MFVLLLYIYRPGQFEYAKNLAAIFKIQDVNRFKFINDFESIGHSIAAKHENSSSTRCQPEKLHVLHDNGGNNDSCQVIGCMGAGTGLGLVYLTPVLVVDEDDTTTTIANGGFTKYNVFPSEGGMVDSFSPRNEIEWRLKKFLMNKYGEYIEIERIVSGPGLADVYRFFLEENDKHDAKLNDIDEDQLGAYVSMCARNNDDENTCHLFALQALDLFLDVYGRALGASAITLMCFSGLYIAGGILSKVLWRLKQKNILVESYLNQGPKMSNIVNDIPLILIEDGDVGLRGALKVAYTV